MAHGFCKFIATICTASVPVGLVVGSGITIELEGDVIIIIEAATAAAIARILTLLSTDLTPLKSY